VDFNYEKFQNLKHGWELAKKKFSNKICVGTGIGTGTDIKSFTQQLKLKGASKHVRIILTASTKEKIEKLPQVRNFKKITGILDDTECKPVNWVTAWTKNYYPVELREFLYKYYNNTLPINSRVGHFSGEGEKGCGFCIMTKNFPPCRETITHLFYDCLPVRKVWDIVAGTIFKPEQPVTGNDFFSGKLDRTTGNDITVFQLICDIFRYLIWESKLLNKIPVPATFIIRLRTYMGICSGISNKIKNLLENNNILANVQAMRR
jgi:hypothetical protein